MHVYLLCYHAESGFERDQTFSQERKDPGDEVVLKLVTKSRPASNWDSAQVEAAVNV